jgi:Ni,Fe-hydrogenase III component G
MRIEDLDRKFVPMAGGVPVWRADAAPANWRALCQQIRDRRGPLDRLVALWGSDQRDVKRGFAVHAAFAIDSGLVWLTQSGIDTTYPGISDLFPAADRMQRTIADLFGIHANEQPGARQWLRHGAWPADRYPLRKDFDTSDAPGAGARLHIRSCGSRATASMRSRSARSMRGRSSRVTSASRSSASACCGSRNGSGTSTRASKNGSKR